MRLLKIEEGAIKQSEDLFITDNQTFYISLTGNDNNEGTFVLPWATVKKAFEYLEDKIFSPNILVTIKILSGHYTLTEQVTLTHPQGFQIIIEGEKEETTLTSVQSSSGGAGNWNYVLNVASTTNITTNDYVIIKNTSSGIRPYYLIGCHEVTNISGNQITINCKHKAVNVASGDVAGVIIILKSVLYFSSSNGFFIDKARLRYLENIALKGTLSYTGITVTQQAYAALLANAACVNWLSGVNVYYSSSFGGSGAISGCTTGILTQFTTSINSAFIISGCTFGLACYYGASGVSNTGWLIGNTYGAFCSRNGTMRIVATNVNGNGTGIYADHSGYVITNGNVYSNNTVNLNPTANTRANDLGYIEV